MLVSVINSPHRNHCTAAHMATEEKERTWIPYCRSDHSCSHRAAHMDTWPQPYTDVPLQKQTQMWCYSRSCDCKTSALVNILDWNKQRHTSLLVNLQVEPTQASFTIALHSGIFTKYNALLLLPKRVWIYNKALEQLWTCLRTTTGMFSGVK